MNSTTPKKILSLSIILLILSCCASTSNPRISSFYQDNNPNDISKKILRNISSASQNKDFHLFFFDEKSIKTKKFLEGARTSFFFQKSLNKNKKVISFKEVNNSNLCEEISTSSFFKIIIFSKVPDNFLANCLDNSNSDILLVYLGKEKNTFNSKFVTLKNQNYFDELMSEKIFDKENFIFLSKDINEIEKLSNTLKSNEISFQNSEFLLIDESNNFENKIAEAFDLNNSKNRKEDLERVINDSLKFVSRSRVDISKVIVSSSSDIANRLIPAFKYNLLFDLEIYNLPNHYDVWKETSSPEDLEGTFGLEYPVLLNRINLGTKDFYSYSPESKINYSLGFDLINFLNYGNGYFGLLGEYNFVNNKIEISPINVSFQKGNFIQSLN